MTLDLLASLFFLCLNFFFVLAEFALVKAQTSRLEVMATNGKMRAQVVLAMMKHLDSYLSAIQIGVTIGTLGLGWAAEPAMYHWLTRHLQLPDFIGPFSHSLYVGLSFCVVIYLQIVLGELIPRSLAIQQAEQIALWVAIPLKAYYETFRLPIQFMAKSSIFALRLMGLRPAGEHTHIFTEDEVRILLGASQEKGLVPLDRLLIIENLFDFADLRVKDAMIPREKVVFLSTAKTWDENAAIIRANHFSRYPLGNPDLDDVAGFIHLKDLAVQGAGIPDLTRVARPLAAVEDAHYLQPLLKLMSSQGKHMMIVRRNGKTVGLITLEDVIEEFIGEILDEFDAPNAWSFHKLLIPEAIDLNLHAVTPLQTVQMLSARLKSVVPSLDVNNVEKTVMARENLLSTAMGKGVAMPHARLPHLDRPLIAVGRTEKPIIFSPHDKKAVRLVFLILTPASAPLEQLRILARVATLAHNPTLLKQLLRAGSAEHFLEIMRTSEGILVG